MSIRWYARRVSLRISVVLRACGPENQVQPVVRMARLLNISVVYAVVEAKAHVQPVVRTVLLLNVGVTGDVCITGFMSSQWCA